MAIILGPQQSRIDNVISMNKSMNDTLLSPSFLRCADVQLESAFRQLTGIDLPKYTCLNDVFVPVYYGPVSFVDSYLNTGTRNQPVKICWRSHSGKIYHLHDEVDCTDIIFWLQDLDLDVLYRHLYGPTKLPFRVNDLPFEVQVGALDQTLEMRFYPHDGVMVNPTFTTAIDQAIHQANEKSRKSKAYQGTIHNWSSATEPGFARYELDMGSASLKLLHKVLKQLAGTRLLKKVVIGRLQQE